MENILTIQNLKVEFHTSEGIVRAVNQLNYQVNRGQTLGIVGESGSGKSVSAMAVMDLLPKPPAVIGEGSSIQFLGNELTKLPPKKIRQYRGNVMSMIFQDPMTCLNPYLRVDTQMIEAVIYHHKVSKQAALQKAREMLEYVHVPDAPHRLKAYPHELSGGMRQRVMIAMALTCDPQLIFADEPTTALDVTVQAQILKLFKEVQKGFETAIVLISHDLGVIATQCDQIIVMYAGQMMEEGTPAQIFEKTAHPYSQALKRSIPKLYPETTEEKELAAIGGSPPNLMHLGAGCPFADRCSHTKDICRQDPVPIKELGNGHRMRCVL